MAIISKSLRWRSLELFSRNTLKSHTEASCLQFISLFEDKKMRGKHQDQKNVQKDGLVVASGKFLHYVLVDVSVAGLFKRKLVIYLEGNFGLYCGLFLLRTLHWSCSRGVHPWRLILQAAHQFLRVGV